MEYLLLALAAVAMGVGWWWLGRRRKALLGDSDDPSSLLPSADPGPPEVFTRESLMGRPRRFDPNAWDDGETGRAAEPADPDDLPTRFDRSYLERTSRRPVTPSSPADSGAAAEPAAPPAEPAAAPGEALAPPARPEPMPAVDEDDQPMYFDREFLERKQRERHQPPRDPDA